MTKGISHFGEIGKQVYIDGGNDSDADAEFSRIHHAYDEYVDDFGKCDMNETLLEIVQLREEMVQQIQKLHSLEGKECEFF